MFNSFVNWLDDSSVQVLRANVKRHRDGTGIIPNRTRGSRRGGVMNTLYYGDNLDILQRHIRDESVDLIYLDPPFNSNASLNTYRFL